MYNLIQGIRDLDIKADRVRACSYDQLYGLFRQARWPNGVTCPHCDSKKYKELDPHFKHPGLYQCNDCRKQFTPTIGTSLHKTKISMGDWIIAVKLIGSTPKISALKLQKKLNVGTYAAVLKMSKAIRDDLGKTPVVAVKDTPPIKPEIVVAPDSKPEKPKETVKDETVLLLNMEIASLKNLADICSEKVGELLSDLKSAEENIRKIDKKVDILKQCRDHMIKAVGPEKSDEDFDWAEEEQFVEGVIGAISKVLDKSEEPLEAELPPEIQKPPPVEEPPKIEEDPEPEPAEISKPKPKAKLRVPPKPKPKPAPVKPPIPIPILPLPEQAELKPVKCGKGKKKLITNSDIWLAAAAIRYCTPHWLTVDGIVEAIISSGIRRRGDLPSRFAESLRMNMERLKYNEFHVRGLEYQGQGRKTQFRILNSKSQLS